MKIKALDYEMAQMAFSSQLQIYRCNYEETCDGLRFKRFDDDPEAVGDNRSNALDWDGTYTEHPVNVLLGALYDDTKLLWHIAATPYLVRQPRKLATTSGGFEFVEGLRVFQAYLELNNERDGSFKHAIDGDSYDTVRLFPEFIGQASTLLPKLLELNGYLAYACEPFVRQRDAEEVE